MLTAILLIERPTIKRKHWAMGYQTRVSVRGPDRGVDLLASPDGLGLLADLVVANYERFDIEGQRLMPLMKVYWPAE